ncbi:MAG TPA: GntG family PLP-dependent aldolase [Thermomicrobiales bacterium]|nr:GntG family PLP-dependent aldolase [Thermomicrobiales bacterium]
MIDLRSDTVTRPTPAMREAMANAVVGDDQYGEDPTVRELELLAAGLLGKEDAVFVASGTMGNLVSLLTHCGRGDEVIMGDECHIFWYESGGAAALGGMPFNLLPNSRNGEMDLGRVRQAIRVTRPGYPRTGAICVENTQNRCGGTVLSLEYLAELSAIARDSGVPVHMDGARIFNAAAAIDTPAEEIARHADSIQFCLTKGLAAPVGSMVVGSADFISRARASRKIVGGAMRQSGVIAAAGIVALRDMIDRLPDDHRRARLLATGLAAIDGVSIDLNAVQSNIVIFQTEPAKVHVDFIAAMKAGGVLVSNYGTKGVRMVTHYEIDDTAIERALDVAATVLAGRLVAA